MRQQHPRLAPFALLALAATAGAQVPAPDPVWYHEGLNQVVDLAKRTGRPTLVYFWMPSSQHCQRLWDESLNHPDCRARIERFTCFSVDASSPVGTPLVQQFGITTLPTVLTLDAHGQPDDAILGYVSKTRFESEADRILAGRNTVSALRERASADPSNLDLRFDLAAKLAYVGNRTMSDVLLGSIRDEDPEGKTLGGARLAMRDATTALTATGAAADWQLAPIEALLERLAHPAVRFQGWSWIAQVEAGRGNDAAARAAYQRTWPHVPAAQRSSWPLFIAGRFWELPRGLAAEEAKSLVRYLEAALPDAVALLRSRAASEPAPDQPAADATKDPARVTRARELLALARGYKMAGDAASSTRAAEHARVLAGGDGEVLAGLGELTQD